MKLSLRRSRALVCRDAVALVADHLEGRLPRRDAARLEQHLAACPHCAEYVAQMRVTLEALGRIDVDDLSDQALEDLVEVYRAWRADP